MTLRLNCYGQHVTLYLLGVSSGYGERGRGYRKLLGMGSLLLCMSFCFLPPTLLTGHLAIYYILIYCYHP